MRPSFAYAPSSLFFFLSLTPSPLPPLSFSFSSCWVRARSRFFSLGRRRTQFSLLSSTTPNSLHIVILPPPSGFYYMYFWCPNALHKLRAWSLVLRRESSWTRTGGFPTPISSILRYLTSVFSPLKWVLSSFLKLRIVLFSGVFKFFSGKLSVFGEFFLLVNWSEFILQ